MPDPAPAADPAPAPPPAPAASPAPFPDMAVFSDQANMGYLDGNFAAPYMADDALLAQGGVPDVYYPPVPDMMGGRDYSQWLIVENPSLWSEADVNASMENLPLGPLGGQADLPLQEGLANPSWEGAGNPQPENAVEDFGELLNLDDFEAEGEEW